MPNNDSPLETLTRKLVTIERHILDEQQRFPEASGGLTNLLYDIALAAKIISREVNRAGLADILGRAGASNTSGDDVKKLDVFANDWIYRAIDHTGRVCVMAYEENQDIIPIPDRFPTPSPQAVSVVPGRELGDSKAGTSALSRDARRIPAPDSAPHPPTAANPRAASVGEHAQRTPPKGSRGPPHMAFTGAPRGHIALHQSSIAPRLGQARDRKPAVFSETMPRSPQHALVP